MDFEYDMHLATLVSNITVFSISDVGWVHYYLSNYEQKLRQ
jgi:hypothetical protein